MRGYAMLGALLLATVGIVGQSAQQFVISIQLSAGSPTASGSTEPLASPVLVLAAEQKGLLRLGDATSGDGLDLDFIPSDLGGRSVIRVAVTNRRGGQTSTSAFELLAGTEAASPTVALRDDDTGRFIADKDGRPLFLKIATTRRP